MANTYYDRYLEAEVLGADPVKLVWLLYRGAIEAVRTARENLAQGDIRGRVREINRAWGILRELAATLDHAKGGEISRRLAGLYSYLQNRLIEANVKQIDQPLEEVVSLLTTLSEAWEAASREMPKSVGEHDISGYASHAGHEQDPNYRFAALALG